LVHIEGRKPPGTLLSKRIHEGRKKRTHKTTALVLHQDYGAIMHVIRNVSVHFAPVRTVERVRTWYGVEEEHIYLAPIEAGILVKLICYPYADYRSTAPRGHIDSVWVDLLQRIDCLLDSGLHSPAKNSACRKFTPFVCGFQ